jgi:hypothetical protein
MKRILATAVSAVFALSLMAGPASAKVDTPADGRCVAAGVKILKGGIGAVAPTVPPGTIAGVIIAHTNGDGSFSGAKC